MDIFSYQAIKSYNNANGIRIQTELYFLEYLKSEPNFVYLLIRAESLPELLNKIKIEKEIQKRYHNCVSAICESFYLTDFGVLGIESIITRQEKINYIDQNKNIEFGICIAFKEEDKGKVKKIAEFCNSEYAKYLKSVERTHDLNVIIQADSRLYVNRIENLSDTDNVELNYNSTNLEERKELIYNLKNNKKGVYLIYGEPGTGKTTFIKSVAKEISKKMIFFPPNMAERISDPNFIGFLSGYPNSIIIIEDAENAIKNRGIGNHSAVSNLLNISDGILSDYLNIQVICTFNSDLNEIDPALMRKGRCRQIINIGKLDINSSNNLLKKIGKNHITVEPMTIADIYSVEQKENKLKEKTRIGFFK